MRILFLISMLMSTLLFPSLSNSEMVNSESALVEKGTCPAEFFQKDIPYGNQQLIFCSSFYNEDKHSAYDFTLYDQAGQIVLSYDSRESFEVWFTDRPLTIYISATLYDDDKMSWVDGRSILVISIEAAPEPAKIKVENAIILTPLSEGTIDQLLAQFPQLKDDDGNFLGSERYISDLFLAAMFGSQDSIKAFRQLGGEYKLDQSSSELYVQLGDILELYLALKS